VGCSTREAGAGPGSLRHQAPLLLAGTGGARVRVRGALPPGARVVPGPDRSTCSSRLSRVRVRARSSEYFSKRAQAAPRTRARLGARSGYPGLVLLVARTA